MKEILVSKTDHGKTFHIDLGSLIVIQLPENPTTGFRWKLIDFDRQVIVLKGSNFSISSDSGKGGGGTRNFILSPLAEGSTKIGLKLLRDWEPQNFADSLE